MASRRQRRVGELLHEEISELLESKVRDPRLGFVTVTGVEVSPDLRLAHVYVSTLGNEKRKQEVLEGLRSAKGFIRREIGSRLRLRYIPDLIFHLDKSLELGDRIEKLFQRLSEEETPDESEDRVPGKGSEKHSGDNARGS
jgi:ribosome-binding factor A